MNKPLVSIIIVNWNGKDVLKTCLQSLKKQTYKYIEILVVDNASTDDSLEMMRKIFPSVCLIENKKNVGFAKGNNIGVKKAKGKYILLFNSDAMATKNFLQPLVAVLEKDAKIGIVQPMVLFKKSPFYTDGSINSIGSYFTYSGFLYHVGYGKMPTQRKFYTEDANVFGAYGACLLTRKSLIDKVGLFDADFFAYFEETDYCMRCLLSGQKIKYVSSSTIFHQGGVSSRKQNTEFIVFHSYKNRICSYIKNLEFATLVKLLPKHMLFCLFAAIAYGVTGKLNNCFAVLKAIGWNMFFLKETLVKRKQIQKIRKIHDINFLSEVQKRPKLSYYYYLVKELKYYQDDVL